MSEAIGEFKLDAIDIRRASNLLKHVSDPIRLQIVSNLRQGEQSVVDLCKLLGPSEVAVSHHLALLRHGGIIEPRRDGKYNFYRLTAQGSQLASVLDSLLQKDETDSVETDWERIDGAVQQSFDELAENALHSSPPIRSVPGRTSGRSFPLFSYRTFYAPDDRDVDEIVVGILFEPDGDRISINGDIGGEESGRTFYESAPRVVPGTHQAVLAAAREIAEELSDKLDVIKTGFKVQALEDGDS